MRFAPLAALVFVVACGERGDASNGADAAAVSLEAAPALEVAAVDEFGPVEGEISGVAFWTHPNLPFNSLVLAATDEGLVAFNIEDGAVAVENDTPVEGISVSYLGVGADARGYAATRNVTGDRGFRFYAIGNESRALNVLNTLFLSDRSNDRGFCLGRPRGEDTFVLYETTAEGWRATPLNVAETEVSAGPAINGAVAGGLTHCVVDDVDGAVFAAAADGRIFRIENGAAALFASSGVTDPAGLGLAFSGLVEGGPTEECCGQITLLEGSAGVVHLFDRDDGAKIGAVRLKASFDVEAVGSARALGFGYGNFGAVYRDGVLALATEKEGEHVLRLTPLNGVMDTLGRPLGPAANPRELSPQEEEPFVIDIDVVNP